MKLYNLFEEVILEGVGTNHVIDAIDDKYRVKIHYAGDGSIPQGERTIEVYAYGTTKKGHEVIRVFQTKGVASAKGSGVQGWKLLRLDRITNWTPVTKEGGGYDHFWLGDRSSKFNFNGDRSIYDVKKIANFNT